MLVNHPVYIFYQGSIHYCSDDSNYRSKLNSVFIEISKFLEIDNFSMLVSVSRDMDYNRVSSFIKEHSVKKVYFFLDDVFQIKFRDNISIDCSIIEQYPSNFSIVEFEDIQQLVKDTGISNEVYYCEYNLGPIKELYPLLTFKFFDITNAVTMHGVFSNVIDFNFKDTFEYKICCFNYRPDVNRSILV